MKPILSYLAVAIFAVFVGSQITEGVLLVPYWQSLSADDFYAYYNEFGPSIGRFYTVLTIIAALIPVSFAVYCKLKASNAFSLALIASLFSILVLACFYVYFKDANDVFYQAALSESALGKELLTWSYWHWGRVMLEVLSLVFLILALVKMDTKESD